MADDAPATPASGLENGRQGIRVGSYRIVQALGSGGMSSVFKAEHDETGVVVAVKVLPRNLARNKTLLQRFLREAKSAEALEHPNVVAIYDHGTDDGRYYLVLEYVEGGDLHDWVRSHGPMELRAAIETIRAVAEGLKFAASLGVIHRDIKPANILRAVDGRIKIADLGLALQADDEDERVTREGTTVGTVDYMAPEQARDSRATSERSDIYSLGCTFFFLLTGQPPYPGGDVTEKLTRHVTAPVPELSGFRPEAPPELNRLIQRMLAKKPENRFANYSELIAALDAIPLNAGAPESAGESRSSVPLLALLDDDSSAEQAPQVVRKALPAPSPTPLPALSMADLAELDESDSFPTSARRLDPATRAKPMPAPLISTAPTSTPVENEDSSVDHSSMPAAVGVASTRPMSDAERSWIVACVAIGLSLIVFVIGSDLLIHATSTIPETPTIDETLKVVNAPQEPVEPPKPAADIAAATTPAPVVPATRPSPPKMETAIAIAAPPLEPTNPIPERVLPRSYPAEVEARFRPEWAAQPVAARLPGKLVGVRRIPDPRDPNMHATLASALDVVGVGTIEVADDGPFFEDELRIVGDARALRARSGFRPIVCLEAARTATSPAPAFSDLAGRELILDGLDLVVDVKAFAPGQNALFLCRGGKLTLRNCTVTVVNRFSRPISLIQTAPGERPSRVRIERSLIRGALDTVVALAGGAVDLFFDRSVVVNGQGSVVKISGTEAGERRVFVLRSVLATRGPALESTLLPAGRPLTCKSLGSTFAHLANPTSVPFFSAHANAPATDLLAWDGVSNEFAGWPSWLSAGFPATSRVAHLAAARTIWMNGDTESQESGTEWSLPAPFENVAAEKLRRFVPNRLDVLLGAASPSPFVLEKTLESFPGPTDPGYTPRTRAAQPAMRPAATIDPQLTQGEPVSPVPASVAGIGSPGERELTFSTLAPEWGGDLGRYLAASIKPGDRLVKVRIAGIGAFPFTPVRLPDGVALELDAQPDPSGQYASWTALRGASAEALLEVRGGGVRLVNVQLASEPGCKLKSLIRVERGHLLLHRCRLRSSGPVEAGGGGLIRFDAPGSLPLPAVSGSDAASSWPFDRPTDKPTCRVSESVLNAAADAVIASAGRCLLSFQQSVVIAVGTAFQLNAHPVARHRLETDLSLDRCTLASEGCFVALGPWTGAEPGPDRPWLVSTSRSVFFGTYARGTGASTLLRVDGDGFAHGALFWQAHGDAFEVPIFTASADATLADARRPDVYRQWIELWGASHVRAVTGPHAPHFSITARPIVLRLRPGRVETEDLFVDPAFPVDSPPPRDLGADLRALGFNPAPRRR